VFKPILKKESDVVNNLSHTKWDCKYHIIFTPKYRRKIIYKKLKKDIREIIKKLCDYKGVKILEGHLMDDHIHILVSIPPKIGVSTFVGYLKGKSTSMIFERHANMKYKLGGKHFWATGYFVSTVGIDEDIIKNYIKNQEREDQIEDQMNLIEYENPFKGSQKK
jgi:putative transposase